MFEKLIESEGNGKSRRSYFVTSSIVVGIIFITAVVLSIYAGDYGLGEVDVELSQLSAPIETVPVEPEPEREQLAPAKSETVSDTTIRTPNVVERTEDSTKIPEGTSSEPLTAPVAPKGNYEIGSLNIDATIPSGNGNGRGEPTGVAANAAVPTEVKEIEPEPIPVPPPVAKPKTPLVVSKGVITGEAKHLPVPPYPAIAKAAGIGGLVKVQVTLDESGKVIAANAIHGPVMLRPGSERAARGARFSPTLLNDTPVKVTGIITYNFAK